MQHAEAQNIKVREEEYHQKVEQLELQLDQMNAELQRYRNNDRATVQIYEDKIHEIQAEWGRKQH